MTKIFKHISKILLVAIMLFAVSCEKEITLDLPPAKDKIVIEGVIETNSHPYVYITKNMGYFESVDTNTLKDILILDAKVTVSDGTQTDTLKLTYNPKYIPPLRYEGSKILGQENMSYKLRVEHDGKVFESQTTIPPKVDIDSIKFTKKLETDTFGFLWVYFKDPDVLGNYYRAFSKTIGRDSVFVHQTYSVIDDKMMNGQVVNYNLVRGRDPARPSDEYDTEDDTKPPYWMFLPNEKVIVKLCTMDAVSYEFWKTVEIQYSANGNPFAAPTTLKTNITGDAIGIWCGYSASIDTVVVNDSILVK